MDKTQIIAEVKSIFIKGKTEDALNVLLNFLESDDQYEDLANEVLQLNSQLSKIKKDESLNLVSYDDAQRGYSRIGNSLTGILERLEKGELTSPDPKKKSFAWIWAIMGIVILGGGGYLLKDVLFPTTMESSCPDFEDDSRFNILLLPFINYGKKINSFEEGYRQRLSRYKNSLSFKTDTEIYIVTEEESITPADGAEATKYTFDCADTVRLVLWGSYEEISTGEIITTTNYKFLNVGDQFAFDQINIGGNLEPVTIASVSSIATQGSATSDIEALLLGIASQQMGDPKSAVALLGELTPSDSSTILLWGMTLANSYMELGNKEMAIKSYDKVLEEHPDYRFALLNRAMLNYQTGNTADAIEDLNKQIENEPDDKKALWSRATIYVKEDQLDKAGKDISVLEGDPTERKKVDNLKKNYDRKMKRETQRKERAKSTLENDPDNLQALGVLSESSIRLGDYQTAFETNKTITRIRPENEKAWANLLYLSQELKMDYKQIIRNANQAGVTNEQLKKSTPKIYMNRTLEIKEIDN
ncbi:MAG: hypothetical protein DWQ02_03930 [Bacteroidetes bacterium]|nr:MAG: hypothetical protein DWQ02_03930 [Bacteroidota bacterium]